MMNSRFAYNNAAAYSAPRPSIAAKFGASLMRAMTMPVRWAERHNDRRAMLRLDDHMLRDIGFDRVQAEQVARRAFWRA
jgi:uncharacterized protein YjiS (DUF1127 family)